MLFLEWDDQKAVRNYRIHGLSFGAAARVFDDPFRITEEDSVVDGEQRWRTVGIADGVIVILVVHLESASEGDVYVRMISARRATPLERRSYEQSRALLDG